jgi:hypothetical protein
VIISTLGVKTLEANTDTKKTRFLVSSSSCAVPVYRDDYSLTGEYIPPGVYEKQSIVQLIRLGDVDPEKCKCASALDIFAILAKRGSEDSGSGLGVAEETTATDLSETTAGDNADLEIADDPIAEHATADAAN